MDSLDELRKKKLISTVMDVQQDYYSHPENQMVVRQEYPEIGGIVAPGAGAEMVDPIMWEALLNEFEDADDYAGEYLKRNKR